MNTRDRLLECLQQTLHSTIAEWLDRPTAYFTEADIQAALYADLRRRLGESWTYSRQVYNVRAWARARPMSLVSCKGRLRTPEGDYEPDLVLWDADSSGGSYLDRRALAVVELKCSFPRGGAYRETWWAPLLSDFDKVVSLVEAEAAEYGLALMFICCAETPLRADLAPLAVLDGRCLAVKVMAGLPAPIFQLSSGRP